MLDQKILDKAIELTHKEIELIDVSHDNDLYNEASIQYGNLYHDLLELCKLDQVFFGLYRLLGEALVEENYDRAATLKKQIEITEPLKTFISERKGYVISPK